MSTTLAEEHVGRYVCCRQCNDVIPFAGNWLPPYHPSRKTLQFSCAYCPNQYTTLTLLVLHCKRHHVRIDQFEHPFTCGRCARKRLSRVAKPPQPQQQRRTENMSFSCELCLTGSFPTKPKFFAHLIEAHGCCVGVYPHQCLKCRKVLSNEKNLKRHLTKVHLNPKPPSQRNTPCLQCDKLFTKKGLPAHMRNSHSGRVV